MDNDIKKEIGNKISQLRIVRKWSRGQMAEKLEMSESNYGHIERGETDIGITRLTKIAEIFEITLHDLLGVNEKTVFNFSKTTVNCVNSNNENLTTVNPTLNNISDLTLKHELEKSALLLQSANNEIENLKAQISQLQEINTLLKKE